MKKAIATEKIFSPLWDGSSREATNEKRRVEAMQIVHKIIENWESKHDR